MKIKGHGGWWAIASADGLEYDRVVHNAAYEVDTEVEIRETRSAGCKGWTEGLPRVRRVNAAQFRVAEDDEAYPQALGFTEGAEVTYWLKRGERDTYDKVTGAIVERVRVTNDQQRARWVEIVCRHGSYERDAEPPTFPPPEEPEEPEEP